MKKFILGFVLLIPHVFASAQGLSMGFYLQPQLTSINGDVIFMDRYQEYKLETKTTPGFGFGLQIFYDLNDRMSLGSGVIFSTQGQDYNDLTYSADPAGNHTIKYSTNTDYVKIPILFEYNFNTDKKITYQLYGGIYAGFLINYEIHSSNHVVNEGGVETYSLDMTASNKNINAIVTSNGSKNYVAFNLSEGAYNTFDYGAQFGAGVVFNVSEKLSIPVSVNYELSFNNMINEDSYVKSSNYGLTENFWEMIGAKTSGTMTGSLLGFRVGVRMRIGENPTFD